MASSPMNVKGKVQFNGQRAMVVLEPEVTVNLVPRPSSGDIIAKALCD